MKRRTFLQGTLAAGAAGAGGWRVC
ncbi:MAG: twin-arginine translocation signal domain-containing protein [Thiothrix sp.]